MAKQMVKHYEAVVTLQFGEGQITFSVNGAGMHELACYKDARRQARCLFPGKAVTITLFAQD
jgi:hypothetical protein